ncbi:MAG: hypothetical protein U9Q15_04205 [Patescibacteria group bacterium]|nr:hypothetical protein [Patescibacteria group bacterium]
MPLLEVEGYQDIYTQFKEEVESKIDIQRISSVFVGGLMYVEKDYKQILKKQPGLDLLTYLKKEEGMYRESREARDFFYTLFEDWKDCQICLDAK